jgi:putative spermidine/putrescine transport system substrate-binding protein
VPRRLAASALGVKMSSKVRVVGLLFVTLWLVAACSGGGSSQGQSSGQTSTSGVSLRGKTLTVSTWGGSWTDAFKKYFADPFSKETGVKFSYVTSGVDPDTPVLLQEQAGNVKIDLVDSGLGGELLTHGYLQKFPSDLLSFLKATSAPGTVNDYWWTYGTVPQLIVCNPRIVQRCPTNPQQFWDVKNYPGERMLTTDPREMTVEALEAAGVSPQDISNNPPLATAQAMLAKIKPYVKVWAASGDQMQQAIANGEIGIGVIWESRVVPLVTKSQPYLKVYWDGAQSESDFAFLVPKGAPNASVSFAFLKWIGMHPKYQAGFSTTLGTFLPGKDVLKYVPQNMAQWEPQSHASQVFYWPSTWYDVHATELKDMWQSTVG